MDFNNPKSLREAIKVAICVGPRLKTEERLFLAVRDFAIQIFGAYYSKATPEQFTMLDEVFKAFTGDPKIEMDDAEQMFTDYEYMERVGGIE